MSKEDKIVPIDKSVTIKNFEPNDECVSLVESILESARLGETRGVAIISQHADDSFSYFTAGDMDNMRLLGMTSQLAHDIASDNADTE